MILSKKIGAIADSTLEAMNNAIASLRERCGEFFFDDVCLDGNRITQATLVYCEAAVNYYQSLRTIDFTRESAREGFMRCLTAIFPDYTAGQITSLANSLKRKF